MQTRITVLVVEDEPLIRMDVADQLDERGFDVIEASNAAEALHALATNAQVELMFTDVDMPGMNGLELAATVRNRWPLVRIIVTSGHRKPRIEEMPSGSRFFSKPHSPIAVARAVRDLVTSVRTLAELKMLS